MAKDRRTDPVDFYPGGEPERRPANPRVYVEGAVRYDEEQALTPAQKSQARANIGAAGGVSGETMPAAPTQRQLTETVKTIWNALGGTVQNP